MNEITIDTHLVKYAKVREGLSINGMTGHIANTIIWWNLGRDITEDGWTGTQNDCQLMLGWVIRAYHQRMLKKNLYGPIPSTPDGYDAFLKRSGYHLEHAIPVACIMWALFNKVQSRTMPEAIKEVQEVLNSTMKVAYVSLDEHEKLNKKHPCTMPKECEHYPWKIEDIWARYTASGVKIPEIWP